jgi:prepilin-type N-terminal cleavage/methylation domain-containing protein
VKGVNQKGFTLLEFIVTLVLVAVVGAMVVSFVDTQMPRSGGALDLMREEFELSDVMERILADYREELNAGTLDLAAFVGNRDTAGKVNALYGSEIDDVQVTATAFQPDPAPSEDYTESGADAAIQKVTLTKGDQILITIFTE